LRTFVVILIALSFSIGIVVTVFVMGGMYQQELFDEYMEDVKNPQERNLNSPDMYSPDIP